MYIIFVGGCRVSNKTCFVLGKTKARKFAREVEMMAPGLELEIWKGRVGRHGFRRMSMQVFEKKAEDEAFTKEMKKQKKQRR